MSQASNDSDVVNDHRVRLLHIAEDEEAVIRVRTKFHVSLVFSSCTIELFEKDGAVYTRQVYSKPDDDDIASHGEVDCSSNAETQPLVDEDPYADIEDPMVHATWYWSTPQPQPEDPVEVIQMAGGDFDQVNEKHAARLECSGAYGFDDLFSEIEAEYQSFHTPDYLKPGETQLQDEYEAQYDDIEFVETQLMY